MQPTVTPGSLTGDHGSRPALSLALCPGSWSLLLPTPPTLSLGGSCCGPAPTACELTQPYGAHGSSLPALALHMQQSPLLPRPELWTLSNSQSAQLFAQTTNLGTHLWPLISPDRRSLCSLRSTTAPKVQDTSHPLLLRGPLHTAGGPCPCRSLWLSLPAILAPEALGLHLREMLHERSPPLGHSDTCWNSPAQLAFTYCLSSMKHELWG